MSDAGDARDALANRDYEGAVRSVRAGFVSYLSRIAPGNRGAAQFLLGTEYGRLAAAMGAEDIFDLMERSVERMIGAEPELGNHPRWRPFEVIASYRLDLQAMRWLQGTVETACEIEIMALDLRAGEAGVGRVKSRLAWMAKAGTVHLVGDVVRGGRAPAAPDVPQVEVLVPPVKGYPAERREMSKEQRAFYDSFSERTIAGERVELEGHWTYGFVLLFEIIRRRKKDPDRLNQLLVQVQEHYPESPLSNFAITCTADLRFLDGDWQGGWDVLGQEVLPLNVYLTLAGVVSDSRVEVSWLRNWLPPGKEITTQLAGNRSKIDEVVQEILDAAHASLGVSLVQDLWQRVIIDRNSSEAPPHVEDEFGGFITKIQLEGWVRHWEEARHLKPSRAFNAVPRASKLIRWPAPWATTYWFDHILRSRLRALYRDAENVVRQQRSLPAVGEGWVSEVFLLRSIQDAFPEHRAKHQGRPAWLGRQSFDVYFSKENVAIEYQGAQHSRPVALFGGAAGYAAIQERDARKRALSIANGCILIEVFPGYDLAQVIAKITEALHR